MTGTTHQQGAAPAPGPGAGIALAGSAREVAAAALEELLCVLPEPCLLVTGAGEIVSANASGAALLGATVASIRGARLESHVADAPADVARYLGSCSRTRSLLPGAFSAREMEGSTAPEGDASVDGPGRPRRLRCAGALARPASSEGPALVLLRFQTHAAASSRFALLNRQLEELSREVRARRAAEAALTSANAQLQEQALELDFANQQLHEQAIELEQQIEAARALADDLAESNAGLNAAAESAQAARLAAEQANRAKSEFLAMMSHELRTPLNAIGGYVELLTLGLRGPLTDAQRADLERVGRSQRHLLVLINEVLSFARIEAGQVRYELAAVGVDLVLREVESMVAPQVQARGLAYDFASCDPTIHVRADRDRMQQVLLNLLSNAVKFTAPGGTIALRCDRDGDWIRIRVLDTGIGIPPEKLERVFEPFVQLDPALTRRHEGVGLGLAISRDLARGMGGDLTAESILGAGATFTLTLPAAGSE